MKYKKTDIGIIPENWEIKTIDELKSNKKNAISMGPFGSNIKKDSFVESGIPIIRGNNLRKLFFDETDFVYVTPEKAEKLKSSKVLRGDIVITHRGTLGQVGYILSSSKYEEYIVSQSGMKLTVDENKINSKYLYYYLNSRYGQHELLMNKSQVGVPAIAQASTSLKKVRVPIAPIDTQNKIVIILDLLSDKIELNNQMIDTLEEMASTLFKRWFIDFEFLDENGNPYKSSGGKMIDSELGEIPEEWEVKSLSEIANYKNGLAMQKYRPLENEESLPVLKIKELNQGYTDKNSDRCSMRINEDVKIYDGDIIFSWSGTLIVDIWTGGNAGLNQHLFKVTSEKYPKWFYYLWTKFYLNRFIAIAKDKATTMGHIKRQHLNESLICTPKNLEQFNQSFVGIISEIENLGKSNRDLEQIRDVLLPKLLSGELEV